MNIKRNVGKFMVATYASAEWVIETKRGEQLGRIEWHAKWHQFEFVPAGGTALHVGLPRGDERVPCRVESRAPHARGGDVLTFLEILGAILGWACIIYAIVSLWSTFGKRRPRRAVATPIRAGYSVQLGPPKCSCGICTGRVPLPLGAQEIANVQAGVIAVAGCVTRAIAGTADYMTGSGVGRVALIICDDALFTQVVEPAIKQHLAATPRGAA